MSIVGWTEKNPQFLSSVGISGSGVPRILAELRSGKQLGVKKSHEVCERKLLFLGFFGKWLIPNLVLVCNTWLDSKTPHQS